jgi:rod shape-determining protein MreD
MKVIGLTLWTYAAFALHAGLGSDVAYGPSRVHVPWLLLIPTVIRLTERDGLLVAAAWGLLADCLTSSPLGIELIGFTVAATVIQRLRRLNAPRSLFATALLTAGVVSAEVFAADASRLTLAGIPIDAAELAVRSLATGTATAGAGFVIGCMTRLVWRRRANTNDARSGTNVVTNRWRMLTG